MNESDGRRSAVTMHARVTETQRRPLYRRLPTVGGWLPVHHIGLAVGIALVAYLVCFPIARPVTLDAGQVGDRLTLAGVNGDERDAGITYRWTTTHMVFAVPGYGGVRAARVTVTARHGRTDGNGRPLATVIPFTATLGDAVKTLTAGPEWTSPTADLTRGAGGGALPVMLDATRYAPEGDTRVLGVQVDRVRVEPTATDWAAGALGGWPWGVRLALCAAVVALVAPGRWGGWLGGAVAAIVAVLAVALPASRLIVLPLLIPATGGILGIGALARGWRLRGRLLVWRAVPRGWASDADARRGNPLVAVWAAPDRHVIARVMVGVVIAVYLVGTLVVVAHMDFIGHADYADTAVRARNLVQGRGDVVDYVAQFYGTYPTITHPAETWPPLLVWMIALAFRLFGVSTVVAKLPNVVVMAGLLALVAGGGAWRWGRRVGVLAALFLAASLPFFAASLVPENDLVFTLLFACFAVALYAAWVEGGSNREGAKGARDMQSSPQRHRGTEEIHDSFSVSSCLCGQPLSSRLRGAIPTLLVGLTAGLLALAKPSGALLVLGAAGAAWLLAWRRGWRVSGGMAIGAAGVAALVYAPWAVRNLVTFGTPFYSTETRDAWVLKYDPKQPTEGIYRVFVGKPLPHPRELVGYGLDHFLAVQGREAVRFWAGLTGGALVPGVVLALAALGIAVGASRRAGFGALLVGAFVPYTAFVLWYWHYEARYFLVLVPWLVLYAAAGLVWLADALIAHAGRIGRVAGPLLALALTLAVVAPGLTEIITEARTQTGGNETVEIAHWIAANTPPDAVVMTRNPWEISWHSGRRAVMLPLGTPAEIYAVMRQYGVTVLELDHINDQSTIRDGIRPLYSWREQPGITHLHYNPDTRGAATYLIYRVDPTALPGG